MLYDPQERPTDMKKTDTRNSTVRATLDSAKPYRLSDKARARLDAVDDKDIDYSDIPEQAGKSGWFSPAARAVENKTQVTLRLDQEILAFFKEQGPRYQSRINAVLRQYVDAHTSAR